jgi:acyl carrier protein
MDRQELTARTRRIIAKQLKRNPEDVGGDADFVELGADSLDLIEITMAVEEEFTLTISDAEAEEIKTLDQTVAWLAIALQVAA